MSKPLHILFVCTGNTGRSVMAEALARQWCERQSLTAKITSAGLAPAPDATAPEHEAAHLLTQRGLDVSTHKAKAFTKIEGNAANLILTATRQHKSEIDSRHPDLAAKTFTLSEYATGKPADIADAFGQNLAFYQHTLDQIEACIEPALRRALRDNPA